ncbi:hypothetical protein GGR51DRAFT_113653 [Nemania sp. FL0031]|nr:hypothetical protein GGR51DRAFT_113653 [Nemania sp. FL0031]
MNGPSSMALETVGHVVAALADSYAAALECYGGWRETQRQRNHYRIREAPVGEGVGGDDDDDASPKGERVTTSTMKMCAASASLTIAKLKIEEAFESGTDVLGDEFVSGDATCRDVLLDNLGRLQDCVALLKRAVEAGDQHPQPLPLSEIISASEAVRISSVTALHKQYQRLVVGRLMPRVLPAPKRSSTAERGDEEGMIGHEAELIDAEQQQQQQQLQLQQQQQQQQQQTPTDRHRTSLKRLSRNSSSNTNIEPPSPPPTPTRVSKERQDPDVQSTYSRIVAAGSDPRPKNSVFSVFCPEAMKYQVDLEKALPVEGTKCRCGYDWNAAHGTDDRAAVVIRDGFRITPRFLGKSHCEKGLGCVLCTSSGRTETFGSVEGLRAHINSSHTKWQLLHDRDLAGH